MTVKTTDVFATEDRECAVKVCTFLNGATAYEFQVHDLTRNGRPLYVVSLLPVGFADLLLFNEEARSRVADLAQGFARSKESK